MHVMIIKENENIKEGFNLENISGKEPLLKTAHT